MDQIDKINFIKDWIVSYIKKMITPAKSLVVGVSGGIDSAVVSTICALTGARTIVVSMPIKQIQSQDNLSKVHCNWLLKKFKNVDLININLDKVFNQFVNCVGENNSEHAFANSRARLRMATLYQIAGSNSGIVVGTGNKVEDFGVGFYTKYGDGGVDISPIADCMKTEIWDMGKFLKIDKRIVEAPPTDGLWSDGRNDEDQLGMTYEQLEEAMMNPKSKNYNRYLEIRKKNLHKMQEIPVCKF